MQHASTLTRWLLTNKEKVVGKRVLIVGGGQTSAHLARLAVKNGAENVTYCSRRPVTRKPFDIDVDCMGDKRPDMLKKFSKMNGEERLAFNKKMRGGGSMSADVYHGHLCRCTDEGLDLLEEVSTKEER